MKDIRKHNTLLTGICGAILLLVLAAGCQGTTPLVTHTVHFAVDGGNGTLYASVDGQALTSPAQIKKGKKIIFTAKPAAGYMVQNWNRLSAANQNATHVEYTVTGDFNITVRFKPIPTEKYTVTIQQPTNGTVSVNPALPSDKKIGKNTELLFTAEPHAGYETGTWTVTGGIILSGGKSGEPTVTVKVTSDMTVSVEFKKKPVQDTPKPPVPGKPEVPPSPPQPEYSGSFGVDGGNGTLYASVDGQALTSPAQIKKGKKIIFTAKPAAGYMVQSWNGLSAANQNATNVEYTVTGDFNITVRFKPVPAEKYTVSIQQSTNGTVSVNPALPSDKKIGKNTQLLFTADPNAGYETGTWTVTGGTILSGGRSGELTATVKVTSDIAVKVEFKKKPVQDTPKPPVPGQPEVPPSPPQPEYSGVFGADGGNGTLYASVDGKVLTSAARVEKGKKIIFTAKPAAGYMVQSWNGLSAANQNATNVEYTVTGDFNITVRFKPVPAEKYTVSIQQSTNGTVSVNPALPSDKKIGKDTELIFTAEPNADYETGTWTVTGGTILSGGRSGELTATVKVTSDTTVSVEFKKKPVQDTPKPPMPGQPEVPPSPPQPENPVPQPPVNPGQEPEGIPVTKLILTDSSGKEITGSTISLELDAQFQIIPVFEPENASDKKLIYNADSALSVTENGMVTALKSGTPTVNVRASNGKNYSVTFNIRKNFDMTFDTEKIETDYNASEQTFRITKKYTGSEYALTVKPSASWFTYEKTGENTKEEVYTLRISKNKSLFERKASFVFETTNRRNKKTLKTIELIQKVNPNPVFRTQWVQGITPPLESDLKTEPATDDRYRKWEETASTTWFNARKLCYTENFKAVQDNQMCWAMSTADLIHWWMRENKGNLSRYMQKKGIIAGMEEYKIYAGEYKGGFGDAGEGNKSSVANVFRKSFPNKGGNLDTAVNWYLRGKDAPLQKEAPPGIVKDVFGGQDDLTNLIISRAVKSKAEFEQMIKEALKEGHAIAVIIKPVKNVVDPLHVVTIWGVVFDEDDSIVELWNSDSNDAYSHIVKFGVHYPGGVPHKINYGAKNDKGDTRIEEVIIMKSAKEQFKTWLDSNKY